MKADIDFRIKPKKKPDFPFKPIYAMGMGGLFLPMLEAHREYLWGQHLLNKAVDRFLAYLESVGLRDKYFDPVIKAFWEIEQDWDSQFRDWLPYFRLTI